MANQLHKATDDTIPKGLSASPPQSPCPNPRYLRIPECQSSLQGLCPLPTLDDRGLSFTSWAAPQGVARTSRQHRKKKQGENPNQQNIRTVSFIPSFIQALVTGPPPPLPGVCTGWRKGREKCRSVCRQHIHRRRSCAPLCGYSLGSHCHDGSPRGCAIRLQLPMSWFVGEEPQLEEVAGRRCKGVVHWSILLLLFIHHPNPIPLALPYYPLLPVFS